jgi:hypothetical protein
MSDRIEAVFEGATSSLRLGIERYEFPEIVDDEWDSNWLIVTGQVELDQKPWRFRDACLATFEIQQLAEWLDNVASNKGKQAFCAFIEPTLGFEQTSDGIIRIGFSLEALPPWETRDSDFGEIGFDVPIDERLKVAANSLRQLLTQFPVREHNIANGS